MKGSESSLSNDIEEEEDNEDGIIIKFIKN